MRAMKITIQADRDQLYRAIPLVREFLDEFPDNHATDHPQRKGVLFVRHGKPDPVKLYVWGNPDHVRVRQVE